MQHFERDVSDTLDNRANLLKNKNLLFWFRNLYGQVFRNRPVHDPSYRVVEVGSGSSPLKQFYPRFVTSDVLPLAHLDLVFDAHRIDQVSEVGIADSIILTNVLHHLADPLMFMKNAATKIKPGGELILIEPYFSSVSSLLLKNFHHEPCDFSIGRPILGEVTGPLSSANQAMPYMIFFQRPDWLGELKEWYRIEDFTAEYYSSLSYPVTGGASKNFRIPHVLYRALFLVDSWLAKTFPKIFAFMFVVRLVRR